MDVTIPCPCPPKADGTPRHDGDTVTLPEVLDFRTTLTVRQEIRLAVQNAAATGEGLSLAEMTSLLVESYLLHCIGGWTIRDDRNQPVPVSKVTVRQYLLANQESAEMVGNAADDLYTEKVVLPLLSPGSSSSPPTPIPGPTSPTNGRTSNRKPSRRSSTTTTPTVATGPMAASPGGASSFSQR